MNLRDSEIICGLLRADSYELTDNPNEADVIIFNTCSVRQHAEEKVWSEIGRMVRRWTRDDSGGTKKPFIGLVGCMAQNYGQDAFRKAPEIDFVVGPTDIAKIPRILNDIVRQGKGGQFPKGGDSPLFQLKIWETEGNIRSEEIYHTGFHLDKNHAFVVISEGCENYCSYCIVPYVRGKLCSRNYQDILNEIKEDIDAGISKITLLGQNVNAYQYGDVNFVNLVSLVNSVKGLKEFSFITSHPKDTTIDLFKAMQDCQKLKKYLHLPVQSGSDRILGQMNRGYTQKFYLDVIDNYRKIVQNGELTTDIIVGFPGEAEKDFLDTYNLVGDVQFNAAYIFKYSVRPHTEASKFPDDVPKDEKERRHRLILELQKEISKKMVTQILKTDCPDKTLKNR
jgi:tRNA-2-methylthio-N6-dimethylallyladenosine synthase